MSRQRRCFGWAWVAMLAVILGAAAPASAGLVHRYSFNDGTANDSVGSLHGTLMGGASVSGGALHLAYDAGTYNRQYVDCGTNDISSMTGCTVEIWFTTSEASTGSRLVEFGQGFSGNMNFFELGSRFNQEGSYARGGPACMHDLRTGTPQLLQATIDNVDLKVYANGVYVGGGPLGTITPPVLLADLAGGFLIGDSVAHGGVGQASFTGSIDEVRIFNHALTPSELAAEAADGPNALVPEPAASVLLAVAGAVGVICCAWRKRR